MTVIFRLLAILLIVATLGATAYWFLVVRRAKADGKLRVSGNIEVTDVQVSFKIPGRVEKRFVDEGEIVAQGAPVAVLDTSDLLCEVAARKAELQVAQAALAELLAGSRPQEIAAAKAAVKKAEHALTDLEAGSRPQEIAVAEATVSAAAADEQQAKIDLDRATQLVQRNAITAEQYDHNRTIYDVAVQKLRQAEEQRNLAKEGFRSEQIEQARAALAQAKAQCELVVIGPREEVKEQAKARVEQAKAALQLAETRLGYASLASPLAGVVLSKNIEPGEFVVAGTPVVTIGDLVNVWLRAYIEEPDLERVTVGQKAIVTTDAGNHYEGRVSFISSEAEFTPKNVQTQKERVKLVYRIKIDVVSPKMQLKPGMPADAVIEVAP